MEFQVDPQGLKRKRLAAGWRQTDLARAAGLGTRVISYLENGGPQSARITTVRAIADALGCKLEDLGTIVSTERQAANG